MTRQHLRICIYCAANQPSTVYIEPSQMLARFIAERGHTLVYGGSNSGLMRIMATTVADHGGKVIGVPLAKLKEGVYQDVDEMVPVTSIAERKATMMSRSDALIILPGGLGTLDEATDALEHKRHGLNDIPIVILNTNNFYKNFKLHLERIVAENLLSPHTIDDLVYFAETPAEALDYVENNCTPALVKAEYSNESTSKASA